MPEYRFVSAFRSISHACVAVLKSGSIFPEGLVLRNEPADPMHALKYSYQDAGLNLYQGKLVDKHDPVEASPFALPSDRCDPDRQPLGRGHVVDIDTPSPHLYGETDHE